MADQPEPILGEIQAFAFSFAPQNWALCQGQKLQANQNAALYSLLGNTYGSGANTFNLPDLRGRSAMGIGDGTNGLTACKIGAKPGAESAELVAPHLPAHTHTLTVTPNAGPMASATPGQSNAPNSLNNVLGALNDPSFASVNNLYNNLEPDTNLNPGAAIPVLWQAGGTQPVNTRQPYLVINYCIAMTGIYPSQP